MPFTRQDIIAVLFCSTHKSLTLGKCVGLKFLHRNDFFPAIRNSHFEDYLWTCSKPELCITTAVSIPSDSNHTGECSSPVAPELGQWSIGNYTPSKSPWSPWFEKKQSSDGRLVPSHYDNYYTCTNHGFLKYPILVNYFTHATVKRSGEK